MDRGVESRRGKAIYYRQGMQRDDLARKDVI